MGELDLSQFCSTDMFRPYLHKPFSRDGFTYATNGHILVRVPLRPDIPDVDKAFNQAEPLQGLEEATFYKPVFNLPPAPAESGDCPACAGLGVLAEGDICVKCDGRGDLNPETSTSTMIGPKYYALNYARLMLSLPAIEVALIKANPLGVPLLFRFEGGVGALMPLRKAQMLHVEIEERS